MNSITKKKVYQLLLLSLAFLLPNCKTDEYDLSNGINTEMTLGGDSLSMPIGKAKPIVLGEMLDSLNIDLLKKLDDGTYSIRLKDSVGVEISAINPVNVTVNPIVISPIATNVADIKFPLIQINPVLMNSKIDVPTASTGGLNLPTINSTYKKTVTITRPSSVRSQQNSNDVLKSKATNITFGPYEAEGGDTVTQSINFSFDDVLKKINKIYFKSNTVTVSFNKSDIRKVGFNSYQDKLINFSIVYPSEFALSDATGPNGIDSKVKIVGSSFIIDNFDLPNQDIVTFTYKVQSLDLSGITQNKNLNYPASIPYNVKYSLVGQADENSTVVDKTVGVEVTLSAKPALDDLDIETNPIPIERKTGNSSINQVVDNLPIEVDQINSLSFKESASLKLKIDNPGISPFEFSAGTCTINLPKMFVFKPFTNLNTTTNVLTIPYSDLFVEKNIGISGVKLDKKVTNQAITVSDALSYSVDGLTVGGTATKLSETQALGTKTLNVTASTSGLEVSNASVTTNKISIDIPTQNVNFNVNQYVSTDVKKINTINLKSPAEIVLKINVANLPSGIDSLFFNNYTIKLPASMKFKSGDVNVNNEMIINRGFKIKDGFTKVLTLESFDFGTSGLTLTNGNFVLNETLKLSGGAFIKNSSVNTSELSTVSVNPTITIGTIPISKIVGQVSPKIDPISENITIDVPEMLKSGDNNLDIQHPVITLEIGNTMGIPVDLAISLIPKRKGVAIPNATISTTISVAAAQTLGEYKWSKYWLAKTNDGVTTGFTPVIIANLSDLLKTFPDEIEIRATPTIIGTNHVVDLYSKKNAMNVKYSVNVPLDFGQNFRIQYRDTISDLKKNLSDFVDYANQVDIVAIVKNEIPLDLGLTLVPLDENNKIITGITMNTKDKIKSCDINGKSQTSIITLGIKEVEEGALSKLNAFDYIVNASKNSTVAGLPLKSSQTVGIELRVRIPKGLTIK